MGTPDPIDLLHLVPRRVPVDNLFLDPNNPRLNSTSDGVRVPDEAITEPAMQAGLLGALREVGLADIIEKIRKLGFLPIDRIVVRPITGATDDYVVLEGNRRVAAVRTIRSNPALAATLSADVRDSLHDLDVLVYDGADEDIAWIIQGFRHIESIKDWGPYQQGRYLVDLKERRSLNVKEVANLAGLAGSRVSRLIRSFYAWSQARSDPDYGGSVDERDFAVFNEAIFHQSNAPIATWLAWDDDERRFVNGGRLAQLLGLLKEKDDGGSVRIPRVNPDLRDKFARLVIPGNESALHDFVSGGDLDRAVFSVQRREDEADSTEALVDLETQKVELQRIYVKLQTLPLPKILESEDIDKFRELLDQVAKAALKQMQVLAIGPDGDG